MSRKISIGEVWKICKNIVDKKEKFLGKIEENIFCNAIIPSESTFSDL